MTTDELLEKLPHMIGRNVGNGFYIEGPNDEYAIGWLNLEHESNKGFKGSGDWRASYDCTEGGSVCMNWDAKEPPYDNAICYGDTAHEALEELYKWCVKHNFIKDESI